MIRQSIASFVSVAALGLSVISAAAAEKSVPPIGIGLDDLKEITRNLIDAENRHDVEAVKPFLWNSPSTLFVAKTANPDQGNWAGFWGADVVLEHFHDLYQGTFHMEPDYGKEKIVALGPNVGEVYLPTTISVSYAGQAPTPKPFLLIFEWIRTKEGWRMATDIALPVPPAPQKQG